MVNHEIGGFFELDDNLVYSKKKILNNTSSKKYLFTGREAIRYILEDLNFEKKHKIAIVPSFTCHTVINEFASKNYKLIFYNIRRSMLVSISYINKLISEYNPDVLLLQPLFGFDTIEIDEPLDKNVELILDMTQNFFNKQQYDILFPSYKLASLRKWGPLVDGAVVEKLKGHFQVKEIDETDEVIYNLGEKSQILRYNYLHYGEGEKKHYLELQFLYKNLLSNKKNISSMTNKSKSIFNNINNELLIKKRQDNYKYLLQYNWEKFGKIVFNSIDEFEVPLFFPLYIETCERQDFLKKIYSKNIYPAIIWPKSDYITEKSISNEVEYIYNHIVAFPIDQRYSASDFEFVFKTLDIIQY